MEESCLRLCRGGSNLRMLRHSIDRNDLQDIWNVYPKCYSKVSPQTEMNLDPESIIRIIVVMTNI